MFEIEYKDEKELIIYPKGELDVYTTEEFKNQAIDIYNKDKKDILIDGKDLEYIDSTGLGTFMYILNQIEKDGKKLSFINIKPVIRKLFTITKLDDIFEMRD
ncbi:STAS domain-containing protein [Peptoniphilus catoniae]|uniref:STAS domain-containing protein n=1 Tax=Peptoniphilus catoniae TaxID=1660341 RepID=UPI0010FDCED5|nr:STAS domain-containing protein [Peptoniphilus catoniae]